jgi:dTDP-glucose 4,6-dehydratase
VGETGAGFLGSGYYVAAAQFTIAVDDPDSLSKTPGTPRFRRTLMALRLRRLLVTGGAGFIGSAFIRQRLKADPEITFAILDKLTYAGSEENLADAREDPRVRFVKGDICDPSVVDELARDVDGIVNFAAESHVDRSLLNAGTFVQTDVYGTYVLLEAARKYKHQRFLQVSTDEVYGHIKEGRSHETDVLAPRSPYSATKAGAEMLVAAYHTSFDVPTLITRGSNTYGPYQFPEKIIPLFITNALQDLPLPIYGNGSAVRDYLFVEDHVSAIARILWKGEPGGAYNVATGKEVSGVEIADTVLRLCGKPSALKHFVKDRPGHDYRYALDTRKLRPLGWEPAVPVAEGLRLTVDWYRRNDAWWRSRKSADFWRYYEENYRGLPANAVPQ